MAQPKVEIVRIDEQPVEGDVRLLVTGTVEGHEAQAGWRGRGKRRRPVFELVPVTVAVWHSHLFADHDALNAQRAEDAAAESKDSRKAARKLRTPKTAREIEVPQLADHELLRSDADRRRYLREQLRVAAAQSADASATQNAAVQKLVDRG